MNNKILSINTEKFIHFESQTISKSLSYFHKVKQLFKSKMYYQKKYNRINKIQILIFDVLYVFRILELLIEIPVRKILHK